MQPRTKKLLGFLLRPNIDELILFLGRGPVTEETVRNHLDVSQSTANRALRDLENWGLAISKVADRSGKRGRKKRYWRLASTDTVLFMDRADAFMNDLLRRQAGESQALADSARRDRVREADPSDEAVV